MSFKSTSILILAILILQLSAPGARAMSNPAFFQAFGLGASGVMSLIDLLNRGLLLGDLDAQQASCTTTKCKEDTKAEQSRNAVGLGFATLPPLTTLCTLAIYGLSKSICALPCATEERDVQRVALVASIFAEAGAATELGTAVSGLLIAKGLGNDPSFTVPPENGRWIASTIISAGSTIVALFSVAGGVVLMCRQPTPMRL